VAVAAPVRAVSGMGEKKRVLYLTLGIVLLIGLVAASQASAVAQTPDPQPSSQAMQMSEGLQEASGEPEPTATGVLEGVVETRTPEPTATPSRIEQTVEQIAAQAGLAGTEFLGVPATDWINLGISLLYVLAGYLIGTWLIRGILPHLVRRTATELDDAFLAQAGPGLRWLVVVAVLQFATTRLGFLSAELKTIRQSWGMSTMSWACSWPSKSYGDRSTWPSAGFISGPWKPDAKGSWRRSSPCWCAWAASWSPLSA